jgi:hypothetical protein
VKNFKIIWIVLSTLVVGAPASAALVTDCSGVNVCFAYDDSTLFGIGTVSGNNIFFLPTTFSAESLNGEGAVTVDDTLDVRVVSKGGYGMTGFALVESGDYFLGFLSGDAASVAVDGTLSVDSNTSAYSDSTAFAATGLVVHDSLTEWDLSTGILLDDTAGWNSDTDVNLSIYNYLAATTGELGEQAFTQKNSVGIILYPASVPVPIPAAVWLFGSALAGLGWMKRKQTV